MPTYSKATFVVTMIESCQVVVSLVDESKTLQMLMFVLFFAHGVADLYCDYAVPLEPCVETF